MLHITSLTMSCYVILPNTLSDKRILFKLQEDGSHPRRILAVSVTFRVEVAQFTDSLPLSSLLCVFTLVQECFLCLSVSCFCLLKNLMMENLSLKSGSFGI